MPSLERHFYVSIATVVMVLRLITDMVLQQRFLLTQLRLFGWKESILGDTSENHRAPGRSWMPEMSTYYRFGWSVGPN